MELITILNHCHRHRGFVYQHARFGPDQKSIEVRRPEANAYLESANLTQDEWAEILDVSR
jgi:hypothetical protein